MVLWSGHLEISSSETAMEALKWPSLRSRRDEHILKLVRKCMDGRALSILRTILFLTRTFVLAQPARANLLHLSTMRTEVARRSVVFLPWKYGF